MNYKRTSISLITSQFPCLCQCMVKALYVCIKGISLKLSQLLFSFINRARDKGLLPVSKKSNAIWKEFHLWTHISKESAAGSDGNQKDFNNIWSSPTQRCSQCWPPQVAVDTGTVFHDYVHSGESLPLWSDKLLQDIYGPQWPPVQLLPQSPLKT